MARVPPCTVGLVLLLVGLTAGGPAQEATADRDALVVEALLRLEHFDLDARPKTRDAVLRWLAANPGSDRFFTLVERFRIAAAADALVRLATERPGETAGVRAARLVARLAPERIDAVLAGDAAAAAALVTALGTGGDAELADSFAAWAVAPDRPLPVRAAAVTALGRTPAGATRLLEIARQGGIAADVRLTAATVLSTAADPALRADAARILPLPVTADAAPLPPIAELVAMPGDAARGRDVFATTGTCAACHVVDGRGREVGPNLSQIGAKLAPEALFVAILDPSAAIAHSYETHVAVVEDGRVVTGLLASRTDDTLVLKDAEGILHTLAAADLESLQRQPVSLMPAGLQRALSAQDLVDLVAYLATLGRP